MNSSEFFVAVALVLVCVLFWRRALPFAIELVALYGICKYFDLGVFDPRIGPNGQRLQDHLYDSGRRLCELLEISVGPRHTQPTVMS